MFFRTRQTLQFATVTLRVVVSVSLSSFLPYPTSKASKLVLEEKKNTHPLCFCNGISKKTSERESTRRRGRGTGTGSGVENYKSGGVFGAKDVD